MKLSVFIIAKNEENRIARAINSVKNIADEIFVVEYGSDDKTVEVAKKCGATVVHNKWEGYGQQKRFGEDLCKNDWILNIDADEEVSLELSLEIKELLNSDKINDFIGYRMKAVNMLWCDKKPRLFAPSLIWIRLYNKKKARFQNSATDDVVVINGEKRGSRKEKTHIKMLKGRLHHRSIESAERFVAKYNNYTTTLAKEAVRNKKKHSNIKILFAYNFNFLKKFILDRFFIYGIDGYFFCKVYAFSRLLKYYKIKELNINNQF